jgi:two-component system, NarL family, sensor histidine kinase UhpB
MPTGFARRILTWMMTLDLDADQSALPERVRLTLFRIYQQGLMNIVRHARASQVDVRLKLNGRLVTLEVQDNGCGFDVPKRWINFARRGHMGLVGAAERAEAAGGVLEVVSQPSQGTLIRVQVPMNEEEAAAPQPG